MDQVFQEILAMATAKLKEALNSDAAQLPRGQWDPDAWEHQVRQFTRELGQQCLQVWAQERARQAQAQAVLCPCGQRRRVKKRKPFWWWSTFGQVVVAEPYLVCPRGHGSDRPFQRLTGLQCRSKSRLFQRVVTDFGAEKSFAQASRQLQEHYGVELHPSSVRQVVEAQARQAESFIAAHLQGAVSAYEQQTGFRRGEPWLVVESDGSMVRTGELVPAPEGGQSPKRRLPKRRRQTQWREVRLSSVQRPGEGERRYGAIMGPPSQVGEQMFALALLAGWGEDTWVHGVGDGAPWIAQQMAEVFPQHRYLLDRYHLLEHLYAGASALPKTCPLSAAEWVERQLEHIDQGAVDTVIVGFRSLAKRSQDHPLNQLARYLESQREHLDYAGARARGLPEGSGAVEGGHRHIIQARLKLPGTWWKEETINPMLALRTLRANGWWEVFWN